jgi:hypothetical protein
MRIRSGNIPMWARFVAVIFGVPLMAALLRVGFERKFDRVTALASASVVMLAFWFFLRGKLVPWARMGTEEKRQEFTRFQGVALGLFAAAMLTGAGVAIYAAVTPGAVWSRVACGIIGLIGLLLALIFAAGSVQGLKR